MKDKIKNIRIILFDVDGVMTDGSITYLDDGTELKSFNVQDGMGVTLARLSGLKTGIITGRNSTIIERRAKELKIDVVSQGSFNKMKPYFEIREKFGLIDEEICYIGDDLLDMPVLERAGFSATVNNAREEIKAICDYVTISHGGHGALREVIDLILKTQGKFDTLVAQLPGIEKV